MATLHAFFATVADMEPGLISIEHAMPLDYIKAGTFRERNVIRYPSFRGLPNFGISITGNMAGGDADYLVVPRGAPIGVREVPLRRGGVQYSVDSSTNPGVVFRPGGMYKDECLISGEVGTPWTDEMSLSLWKLFSKLFFREFVRINLVRLGPEALRHLHNGLRLAQDVKFSRECDLSPSAIASEQE